MRSKLTSRMLAWLLAVVMVVGLLPISALAARIDRDDVPVAEVAMGEEAVTTPVRAPSKAAEAAEMAEGESAAKLVTVAKAELGTSASFGGDQVALSNALYTFAANGTGYTISATVPGTETTVYLNIAGGTNTLPNMTSANSTPVGLTEQTDSNSNKWLELRDGSSLHFHRGANELYFNRFGNVTADDMPNHYFALFRAATEDDTSSGDIPGYVRLTALNEVTSGEKYLIAAKVSENWYVLYPTTGSNQYNHVAKVVLVEEVVETPDEPETPVEKPRYYFESVNMEGGAWKISDGSVPNPNTVETQNGSNWVSATEIVGGADRNYRLWAPGPGYLNFDKVGDVLLTNKLKGGQNAASIQFKKQDSNVYLISYVKDGTTYYLTAENQTSNDQDRAVFSSDKADAVPYFIEAETAGSNVYRIYCEGPYNVTLNNGTETEELKAMYGATLPTPADREGYTFLGWFDGETKYTEATADVTLTAKWKMDRGYTPAEAVAEGKTVTYLAFTGGTNSSRWWDAAEEAGATTHIQLYNAAGTATDSAITLDTDGITAGNYVINFDTGSSSRQALMHYSNGVSNQCGSSTTTVSEVLHLFVFEKAEDNTAINAFTIKAYNTTKYLSLEAEASGNNRLFKDDKTTFYVTPVNETNDGAYYIWTAVDPEPDPGDDDTQTCANPAEAVAEGKTVTYLAFTGGTNSNRWWDAAEEAGDTTHIQLYNAAGTAADSATTLDTDGITAGNYVINFDTGNSGKQAVMHYSNGVTNQCSSVSVTCGSNGPLHLFVFEKAEDNTAINAFTIKAYNTTKYLSLEASGSQRAFKDDKTVFYVTPVNEPNDGTYYIWTATEPQVDVITPPVEPEGDVTMAQTKFSGTSDKPMDRLHILNQDDDVDTDYRIPALTTLDNGWIVAACDIRWSSTDDSPNNLDTIVSISKDGGVSWEWEVVNYFSDFAPINGSKKLGSASFIDPAVVQSEEDGSIYLLVDAQAPYVNGGKIGNGFDDQGRLKISKSPVNGSYSMENAHDNNLHGYTFNYYVDINNAEAGANYPVDGETVKLWPICANDDDQATGYYVDAFFNTYYDYGEGGMRAVIAQQHDSTAYIHNNIFYTQSEWKVFPTAFLMLRKATVNETTGKLDWGEPTLISSQIKYDNEHFIGVCPGRGFTTTVIKNDKTVERILFALYDNATGTEKASVIYSDDGGVTWNRGARVENGETRSNSESQIVELHDVDGNPFLRMFSRNPNETEYVSYADSFDNGLTWTTTKFDRNMPNGHGTMMSFIGLEGFLVSPEGDVYEDVVLASYPRGDESNSNNGRRTDGIVRIGYYDAENEVMVWLNDEDAIRYPYKFTYSCLTQLRDEDGFTDRFALLYEDERTWANAHGMEMGFDTFTSAELLGEGWSLVQEKPELPTIENTIVRDEEVAPVIATANVLDLDKDTSGALTAAVTLAGESADDGEKTVVVWTSSDESVATVSKTAAAQASLLSEEDVVTEPGEQVVINAVGVGRAYITAATTKNGVTRKAVTEVVVQGENDITVPEHYLDEMVTADTAGTTTYTVSADGLEKLIEVGGDAVEEDYTETLELAATYTDKAKADEAQAQIDEVAKALYAKLTGRDYEPELPEAPEADVYTVGSIADRVYTGEALEPTVVVRKNGAILTMGYTLEYKNNVNVGEATVEVVVGGKVVATGTFRIVEDSAAGDDTGNTGNTGNSSNSVIGYFVPPEEELDDLDVPLAELPMTFEDVKADDWFYEAAEFVFANDLMQGVSATEFRPSMNTTRGMVVTILHRMEKEPEADPATFTDVASTAWYGPAVAWGAQSEVVKGMDDGGFHPTDAVTREQLAVFLYRFAEYSGYDVSTRGELSGYADSEAVSSWAKEAMSWAVGTGLITGKDGNVLAPLSAATRAELAAILTRFCQQFAEEK